MDVFAAKHDSFYIFGPLLKLRGFDVLFHSVENISYRNTIVLQVIEAQEDMPILSAVTLYSSLLKFTLHVHPDRLDYADQVLVSFLFSS